MFKVSKRNKLLIFLTVLTVSLAAANAFANTTDATEMDDVWTKVSAILNSGWGKLIGITIGGQGIAMMEKMGKLYTATSVLIGILLPGLPGIYDTAFTLTI
ncbi:MAG: hypothetical protein LBH05_03230 [Deferribacteraceae bacterium]|jgi:hypothetical protein|nr:hypothetical protein [Deferribacteraceae bacterium]